MKNHKITIGEEAVNRMAKAVVGDFDFRLGEIKSVIRTKTLGQEFTQDELERVIRDIADELYRHYKAPELSE